MLINQLQMSCWGGQWHFFLQSSPKWPSIHAVVFWFFGWFEWYGWTNTNRKLVKSRMKFYQRIVFQDRILCCFHKWSWWKVCLNLYLKNCNKNSFHNPSSHSHWSEESCKKFCSFPFHHLLFIYFIHIYLKFECK